MDFEKILLSVIEWLKNVRFDEIVYGQVGKIVLFIAIFGLWIYIASWIYKDSLYRYPQFSEMRYFWLIFGLILAPVAWFLYIVFRPVLEVDEASIQQAEERYLLFEMRGLGYCAKCGYEIDPDFCYCPHCGNKVRIRCKKCGSLSEMTYTFCPRCGEKTEGGNGVTVLPVSEKWKADQLREKEEQEKEEKRKELEGKKEDKKHENKVKLFLEKIRNFLVESASYYRALIAEKNKKKDEEEKRKIRKKQKKKAREANEKKEGEEEKKEKLLEKTINSEKRKKEKRDFGKQKDKVKELEGNKTVKNNTNNKKEIEDKTSEDKNP
jgi:predicted RNA-binding Zn-ribbon protein involved in translation (DUF1610 family)